MDDAVEIASWEPAGICPTKTPDSPYWFPSLFFCLLIHAHPAVRCWHSTARIAFHFFISSIIVCLSVNSTFTADNGGGFMRGYGLLFSCWKFHTALLSIMPEQYKYTHLHSFPVCCSTYMQRRHSDTLYLCVCKGFECPPPKTWHTPVQHKLTYTPGSLPCCLTNSVHPTEQESGDWAAEVEHKVSGSGSDFLSRSQLDACLLQRELYQSERPHLPLHIYQPESMRVETEGSKVWFWLMKWWLDTGKLKVLVCVAFS